LRVAIHLRRGELFHSKTTRQTTLERTKKNSFFLFKFRASSFSAPVVVVVLEKEKETPKVFHTA
jgi:hypothetical protein